MKVLLDIGESKVPFVMELLNNFDCIKIQMHSKNNEVLLDEIKKIRSAFHHTALLRNGKIAGRPVQELLNEL